MYPLFESICLQDGQVLHPQWHRLRFQKTFQNFFGQAPPFDLLDPFDIPQNFSQGKVKLKIRYNASTRDLQFQHYKMQNIQSIRLVSTDDLDYAYKYSRREKLESLFALRGACDDVLIVRKGLITDSSYANVIFFDGGQWWTPKVPLLEGTCRARLLADGQIKEVALRVEDIKPFKGLKLINALRDMDQPMIPIESLVY